MSLIKPSRRLFLGALVAAPALIRLAPLMKISRIPADYLGERLLTIEGPDGDFHYFSPRRFSADEIARIFRVPAHMITALRDDSAVAEFAKALE